MMRMHGSVKNAEKNYNMKTIGLVGGLTWHSTALYYKYINEMVNEHLGADHSAKIIISSLDFEVIKQLSSEENWDAIAAILSRAATGLQHAGADFIMIASNTMHIAADQVEAALSIPFLHIADAVAAPVLEKGLDTVSLLGTKYTMQNTFFRDRLQKHGIRTIVPDIPAGELINSFIYNELARGIINDESRESLIAIVDSLAGQGADGVVLGCTELPMLLKPEHCPFPLFDTTFIHAKRAVEMATS